MTNQSHRVYCFDLRQYLQLMKLTYPILHILSSVNKLSGSVYFIVM